MSACIRLCLKRREGLGNISPQEKSRCCFVCTPTIFSPMGLLSVLAQYSWSSFLNWQADSGNRTKRHSMDVPYAVLDLEFAEFREGVFAIATSNGQVRLCTMDSGGTGPIEHIQSYQIFSESTITLSLAWNRTLPDADAIAASSSDGQIAIFNTENESPITYAKTVAHSLEAWALAWSSKGQVNPSPCLYSGGDDSALCTHDLSVSWPVDPSFDNSIIPSARYGFKTSLQDTKTHMAGVTAILPLNLHPYSRLGRHILLTGSYDEYVRLLLPIDGCSRPKVLAERSLGGGVWSLKHIYNQGPYGGLGKGIPELTEFLSNPVEARILSGIYPVAETLDPGWC